MNRADGLLEVYTDLDFHTYIALSDEICRITRKDLETDMVNHARVFSYYAALLEEARKDVEIHENKLEQRIVDAKMDATEALKSEGVRATVAAVESLAMSNADVREAQDALSNLKYKMGLLRSLTSALSHKKDMLVQLLSLIHI